MPTLVAGFGVLAMLEGQAERASELFELLTATRSPASTAATYEVIGDLEGWSDDGFANAKVVWALTKASRQSELERREYFGRLNALVREEVQRFA